jgi:thymidine kinase
MEGGKSLELLKTADTYERQGKRVTVFTAAVDTRHGVGKVTSRIGLQRDAIPLDENTSLLEAIGLLVRGDTPDVVLVDEAQFLSRAIIEGLAMLVDEFEVPVICYGLKNTFTNELFEGSAALLSLADSIVEIKGTCADCVSKSTMNMRLVGGIPQTSGEELAIEGRGVEYMPLCRPCYKKRLQGASKL